MFPLYSHIKTKEDILAIVYSRILASFERRMQEATQGIADPRLQLKAAIEGTLRVYAEFQEAVVLSYQESHALKRWNLKGYTLEAVIENLTDLILGGVAADGAVRN